MRPSRCAVTGLPKGGAVAPLVRVLEGQVPDKVGRRDERLTLGPELVQVCEQDHRRACPDHAVLPIHLLLLLVVQGQGVDPLWPPATRGDGHPLQRQPPLPAAALDAIEVVAGESPDVVADLVRPPAQPGAEGAG